VRGKTEGDLEAAICIEGVEVVNERDADSERVLIWLEGETGT